MGHGLDDGHGDRICVVSEVVSGQSIVLPGKSSGYRGR